MNAVKLLLLLLTLAPTTGFKTVTYEKRPAGHCDDPGVGLPR